MAELERLANHFGDIGAICNDAAFALMHAHCGILRERVLRAADACFGHRLMMDRIVPGGVAADLDAATARPAPRADRRDPPQRSPSWSSSTTTPPRCRTARSRTGIVAPELARQFGAGGYVGRASGRAFDARRAAGLPALRPARVRVPVLQRGRRQCARLDPHPRGRAEPRADRADPGAPAGRADCRVELPAVAGEGWRWSRRSAATCWSGCGSTPTGASQRCHLRDPSWFQWPLLEAAIEGNIVADFPLCNKSFNCSYSGHDL